MLGAGSRVHPPRVSSVLKAKKSDIEIAKLARERTIRDLATKQMDENSDLVKMLNTLGARAAAFTIRDQQLEEKHARAHIEDVGWERAPTLGVCWKAWDGFESLSILGSCVPAPPNGQPA